ncbi:MAG TPA: PRC-barrel domain-containing protein [Sphingomicrobium sp.]|nr:PRC-barrel domain-containing protein [Sphingomicrobium sp.]
MPRHEWRDDELMSRERGDMGYGRDRGYRDFDDRDRGAFFGGDRGELSARRRRSRGGWGSLLSDESSGGRGRRDYREEQRFGPDDERPGIPRDETERLIASNKVEGTPVYDRNGDRLGSVHNFMVDKFRGRVVYAVLKSGTGFLGLDDRYYPLDWDQLTFDTRLGGYRVNLVEEDLERFGSWDRNERWSERGAFRGERGRSDRERDYERRMRDRDEGRMIREPW